MVDLYRGVAQYGQFMTPYLRRDTLARGLEKGIHYGRIYRIVSTAKKTAAFPRLSKETSAALVGRCRMSTLESATQRTPPRGRGDRPSRRRSRRIVDSGSGPLGPFTAGGTLEGLFASLRRSHGFRCANGQFSACSTRGKLRLGAPTDAGILDTCLKAIADPNQRCRCRDPRERGAGSGEPRPLSSAPPGISIDSTPTRRRSPVFQATLYRRQPRKARGVPLLARIARERRSSC